MQRRTSLKTTLWGIALLALCGLSGCADRLDPEQLKTFDQAQQTFDRGAGPDDFLKAAALYQSILDRGVVCGAVLYNQGNAFMRAGQRGRAIAAYRLAQRYRPRDPYLEANLQSALGAAPAARRPLVEHVLFWQDWLSYREKFQGLALAMAAACALGWLAVLRRRRLLVQLALAATAAAVLLAVSAGYDWYRYEGVIRGVIVVHETTARKGNAASYEPALNRPLAEGTEFELVERRGDWLLVRLAGDQEGWIPEHSAATY